MDEFDYGGQRDVLLAPVAASVGAEQYQQRAQSLAAAGDNIVTDLLDQGHSRPKVVKNIIGYRIELRLYGRIKLVWLHGRGSVCGLNTRRMLGGWEKGVKPSWETGVGAGDLARIALACNEGLG